MVGWGKWKWNAYLMLEKKYFYIGQGYSGERCGPWASCSIRVHFWQKLVCNPPWHLILPSLLAGLSVYSSMAPDPTFTFGWLSVYSSIAPDPTFTFFGHPCCPILYFVYAVYGLWLRVTHCQHRQSIYLDLYDVFNDFLDKQEFYRR
jgi:hypothetical protein